MRRGKEITLPKNERTAKAQEFADPPQGLVNTEKIFLRVFSLTIMKARAPVEGHATESKNFRRIFLRSGKN